MNYFVSIENTIYHHWQVELLLQSCPNTTVAIAETTLTNSPFTKNLSNAKKFLHPNLGKNLNQSYALNLALDNNLLKEPLTILHPDMILVSEPVPTDDITFSTSEYGIPNNLEYFYNTIKNHNNAPWIPVGNVIILKHIFKDFIKRVFEINLSISKEYNSRQLSWALAAMEFYGHIPMFATNNLESNLTDIHPKCIIHYNSGFPPDFSKNLFKYQEPDFLTLGNPHDSLKSFNNNPTMIAIHNVVTSYQNKDT